MQKLPQQGCIKLHKVDCENKLCSPSTSRSKPLFKKLLPKQYRRTVRIVLSKKDLEEANSFDYDECV